jgi:peptidylprolyl isomerase
MDDSGVPQLDFTAPLTVSGATTRLVSEGDGQEMAIGDAVTFEYTVTSGDDQSSVYSSYDDPTGASTLTLDDASFDPNFLAGFIGHKVGEHFIYAAVSQDVSPTTGGPVTYVFAIIVTGATTPLARAEGTAVAPVDGLPVVTLADDGAPSIEIPAGDPPTELVAQTLIEGTGPAVTEGQTIVAHYTGWLWDGTQFDSSWENGAPATFPLASGQLIDGWVQGLPGETVGSQVLLVIPPDLGYGADGSGTIPGDATLVFVVDILAAV